MRRPQRACPAATVVDFPTAVLRLQMFASVHASICNYFNQDRTLSNRQNYKIARTAALAEWRQLSAAGHRAGLGKQRLVRICPTQPNLVFRPESSMGEAMKSGGVSDL